MDPTTTALLAPGDMSLWALIRNADPVVQVILVLLAVFSVWCWAVMIEKFIDMKKARQAVARLEQAVGAPTIDPLLSYSEAHPLARVVEAGNAEWRDVPTEHSKETLAATRERVEHAMRLELGNEVRRMQKRLPFLATVGSAAPFIGLFGTVWGIMNAFIGIGVSHDTSLAVVAPGIAEALIATGVGLAAAIPAVMAYNKFATETGRYSGRMQTAIGQYSLRLSKRLPPTAAAG
ncbi:MAG TPA: MotA/TolQ/ExbB proton channel family protein [Candidatus Binatia bacterium]|nr:MotA/TolQ/ExbB proton channel family protein [Candidatus Binatia bacterium]